MKNEQKTTPENSSSDVITPQILAKHLLRAVMLVNEEPQRPIYIGQDNKPEAVLISHREHSRLTTIDADAKEVEEEFQAELHRRTHGTPGTQDTHSTQNASASRTIDDVDALFAQIRTTTTGATAKTAK